MKDTPLYYKSISDIGLLIAEKKLSPVEITETMLNRISETDNLFQAYATVMGDRAIEQARAAETALAQGNYIGPLHGVPIAVKDLCFTKDVRTMGGTRVLMENITDFDSTVVQKLYDAGAIILGKLNLTEGAMAGYKPDLQFPNNP